MSSLCEEEWRSLPGFADRYEVSSHGRVRRSAPGFGTRPGRLRTQVVGTAGYLTVCIKDNNGAPQTIYVHRAVAEAFHPNPDGKKEVDHIDGCKVNNAAHNLRWATRSENQAAYYAWRRAMLEERMDA